MVTRPRRVTVTSPQTRLVLARRRSGLRVDPPHLAPADLERARAVHRVQLRLALGALAVLALLVVGLPLALAALDEATALGVPVSWIAVGVVPYFALTGLAAWQLRRAERAERHPGQDGDRG